MVERIYKKLKEKGWAEEEIKKAIQIITSEEKKKKYISYSKHINPVTFWLALIVVIIGNIVLTVALIPILLIMSSLVLYSFIIIIGFMFGLLFNLLTKEIEFIDYKHYIIGGVFIPALALLNIYIVVIITNNLRESIQLSTLQQNPFTAGLMYVAAFLSPYIFSKIFEMNRI